MNVNNKCPKCGKTVYQAEQRLAAQRMFHKQCLKCEMCNKSLDSNNLCERPDEAKIYCKGCYGRKHGPKGYGFGGGAGALSMDTGAQFGNTESEMGNKPTLQAGTGGPKCSVADGGCPRCGTKVYEAEKRICKNMNFHKGCFNCKDCHKALDSTTAADHGEDVWCKNCYGKNFGPSGVGFGIGAGCLSTN